MNPVPGHALVTRRAVADVVRDAAAGSYGVVGFVSPDLRSRLLSLVRYGTPGVAVRITPTLDVRLSLRVAFGVPIAEVASNVESAVRYAVRHALGRDIDSVAIHIGGLQVRRTTRSETGVDPE
ncbi:MAG TPA: Asp23/Gls24 family envelope stress response protein [Candidatus Acidoferrales bacterium]|nr:Asp23/Gls24 family envelope stress response protein [Candidatus Acidoferrales bacterium]